MKPKLYYSEFSPPVRGSLLTIAALGLDVELVPVNLLAREHLNPEYLKLNPLHTVPTLEDGDFVLFDSHAINAYLVDKYGKDDSLYPKDLHKRAVINQRLFFDCGIVFASGTAIVRSLLIDGHKSIEKDKADRLTQAYDSLETLLERSTYAAGEELSIADFSLAACASSGNVMVPIASSKYPRITEWLAKMEALPYYAEANQKGLDVFARLIKSKLI